MGREQKKINGRIDAILVSENRAVVFPLIGRAKIEIFKKSFDGARVQEPTERFTQ